MALKRPLPKLKTIRHAFIPDTQIKPNVPTDHLAWIAAYLCEKQPDKIILGGDWWDFPSLNSHDQKGSLALEGTRFRLDVEAGNIALHQFNKALKCTGWNPDKYFLMGNHEHRADRVPQDDFKWVGTIGSNHCNTEDFKWMPFLQQLMLDGVAYQHYFQAVNSDKPIGGNIDSRLAKIGSSFVQGHVQGRLSGNKLMANGRTYYGLVSGSCYLHRESYRGNQNQRHWRGIEFLNDVEDGEYDEMPISLRYLCKLYENMRLVDYMNKRYPGQDWSHLA